MKKAAPSFLSVTLPKVGRVIPNPPLRIFAACKSERFVDANSDGGLAGSTSLRPGGCRVGITRPTYFASVLVALLVLTSLTALVHAEESVQARGGRVGWARIITSSVEWRRHAESDPHLTEFIRGQTSLNIDPTWYSADPSSIEQLSSYPLLYTNNLTDVVQPSQQKNLREYLKRGGFILIDSCINPGVTPDPDAALARHIAYMAIIAPGAEIRELPKNHDIYRNYFTIKDQPPHTFMNDVFDKRWAHHGLYGVFDGDRMIALITLSGLQCSWSSHPDRAQATESMKMIVNIYVYAMTR